MDPYSSRTRGQYMGLDADETTTRPQAEGFRTDGGLGEQSLGTLVSEFIEQGRHLLRAELTLARTEMRAEAKKAAAGGGMVAAGGVVLFLGAMALVAFLVIALAELMPLWASALLVTVLLIAAGAGLAAVGAKRLKTVHAPRKTIQTLKEDSQWASTTMRSAKSQMHGHA
ncbi:phage holin family protein [Corallococcus macrosporus]|uniref:Phage holin family protein n=1 Tax=Corallococcus macrosporus TaxID=35 RepID=A0ABS3DPG7_9BACT|nr:phage holin family protein [Corallococcus macrosporus]MBN8233230.1 phage holin family protein [Corallococcus macrosporus]